jgi:hypothetical protein
MSVTRILSDDRKCQCVLQSNYRDIQENPCNENRDPAMRTGFPCIENRFFPVGIDLQGVPCKPYRVWVYSVGTSKVPEDYAKFLRLVLGYI